MLSLDAASPTLQDRPRSAGGAPSSYGAPRAFFVRRAQPGPVTTDATVALPLPEPTASAGANAPPDPGPTLPSRPLTAEQSYKTGGAGAKLDQAIQRARP